MKRIITIIVITTITCFAVTAQSLQPHDSIRTFVDYLNKGTHLSASEYILNSFNEKDIVVLSERLHPEFTQYEMIVDVLKNERFKGNVYTEIGVFNSGVPINEFLLKEGLSKEEKESELLKIYRNIDYDPIWPDYNFYYLISSIYDINQQRKPDEKIFLYPLDLKFSWDSIKCNEQYNMIFEMMEPQNNNPPVLDRNVVMARHFIRAYEDAKYLNPNKKKALVIMNTYHGYTRIPKYLPNPTEPLTYSASEYIYKTYPNSTKGILINFYPTSYEVKLVAGGKWDAAFKVTGISNAGFDIKGSPFGKTEFDMYNFGYNAFETVNFEYIFDGLIYFEPIENFQLVFGIPGIFNDPAFVDEYYRRAAFEENITIEEARSSKEIKENIEKYNVKKVEKMQDLDKFSGLVNKWIIH